jgi:hypothetical protein
MDYLLSQKMEKDNEKKGEYELLPKESLNDEGKGKIKDDKSSMLEISNPVIPHRTSAQAPRPIQEREKYIVRAGNITKKINGFVYTDSIITSWTAGMKSSFLTTPQDIQGKFFYIIRNKNHIYEKLSTNNTDYQNHQITENKLNEFIENINTVMHYGHSAKSFLNTKWAILLVLFILIIIPLAIFIWTIIQWPAFDFRADGFIWQILSISFFGMGVLIVMPFSYFYYKDFPYFLQRFYARNGIYVQNVLNHWNKEYFQNLGVCAVAPRTLEYIQLNLDQNIMMCIEHVKNTEKKTGCCYGAGEPAQD